MKVIIVKNATEGGKKAFEIFKEKLDEGATVFGLATGGTPETTYQELCDSDLDFSNCISINLDEYVGLSADNPQSYHYYMKKHLFEKKPFAHSYLPDGRNDDAKAECERYSKTEKIRLTCSCLESVATDTSVLMSQGRLLTARRKRFA